MTVTPRCLDKAVLPQGVCVGGYLYNVLIVGCVQDWSGHGGSGRLPPQCGLRGGGQVTTSAGKICPVDWEDGRPHASPNNTQVGGPSGHSHVLGPQGREQRHAAEEGHW